MIRLSYYYVITLLYYYIIILLYYYITILLYCYSIKLLHYYVIMVWWYYITILLYCYIIRVLCYYVIALLYCITFMISLTSSLWYIPLVFQAWKLEGSEAWRLLLGALGDAFCHLLGCFWAFQTRSHTPGPRTCAYPLSHAHAHVHIHRCVCPCWVHFGVQNVTQMEPKRCQNRCQNGCQR